MDCIRDRIPRDETPISKVHWPASSSIHDPYILYTKNIMAQVIVVGGGLAGLSAAHTLLERGANVLLLDKQGYVYLSLAASYLLKTLFSFSFMGGNSTKATSGINGAGTNAQKELNIPDSAKIFFEDTKKSVRPASPDSPRSCTYEDFRLVNLLAMTSLRSLLAALVTPSTGSKANSVSIFQRSPVSVATASPVPTVVMLNSPEWCVSPSPCSRSISIPFSFP